MLTVNDPNEDRALLTIEDARAAIGLDEADDSEDATLEPLRQRVSAIITAACRVAADGATPATLRLETATDTYRLKSHQNCLILSRRPVDEITSIIENGTPLIEGAEFECDKSAGLLYRLSGDVRTCWPCGKVVVVYGAGWEVVPEDLKLIASRTLNGYWLADGVDPMEKSVDIPDIISVQRWVDAAADGILPTEIVNALSRGGYVNYWVG